MTTTTIRNPGELIASLPSLIGDSPDDLVVVLGLGPKGIVQTVSLVHRVDLCLPELAPDLAPSLAADLVASGADFVIAVSWHDGAPDLPCAALAELVPVLASAGLGSSAWITDGSRYWSPDCEDPTCCPPQGRPLPAPMVLPQAVQVPCTRHTALAMVRHVDRGQRRNASRAADRWTRRRMDNGDLWREQTWAEILASMNDQCTPARWGKVVAGLQDVRVRDALIVYWFGATDDVVHNVLGGVASPEVERVLEGALYPGNATVPHASAMTAAHQWCEVLGGHCRRDERAVVHTLSSVLSWWEADFEAAQGSAVEALLCDPDYTLAHLVGQMCRRELRPGWQREEGHG